jgi:hypothetical protein
MGVIVATSRSLHDIIVDAKTAIVTFASQLQADGSSLLVSLRKGSGSASQLVCWIRELLDARANLDAVRMADLLEYEILPRLVEQDVLA